MDHIAMPGDKSGDHSRSRKTNSPQLAYCHFSSPVGDLLFAGDGERIHVVGFSDGSQARAADDHWRRDDSLFRQIREQMAAYFAGELKRFDLLLHLGGTDFQNAVWTALLDIPFGQTTSYGALAAKIGRPKASRAVGAANGANPIPIIVPCHRVIGADNSLTGFGGGVETKAFLLRHEGVMDTQPLLI